MTSGIYKIINVKTGKIYIGSAKNIKGRLREHLKSLRKGNHKNKYLQFSWNEYGEENFRFEIIEIVENIKYLIEREQYWLDYHKSYDRKKGYNFLRNAGSVLDLVHTKETKDRISKANKSPELHSKRINYAIEQWKNPEFRDKVISSQIGRKASQEARENLSRSHKGKKPTLETLEKRREAFRKLWSDPEYKESRKPSLETKSKISDALKGRKLDTKACEIRRENSLKRWSNPEFKEKMKIAIKNSWKKRKELANT